jgi:5-methylthioadenosine/S-adenosylhomocysteine deaminase
MRLPALRPGSNGGSGGRTIRFLLAFGVFASSVAAAPAAPKERVDLLVRNGVVVTVDRSFSVHPRGAVAVRGGAIVAVGEDSVLGARYAAKETFDARGGIVMPGLVNGHNHAAMSLLRGGADDRELMDWLRNFIFPAEAKNVSPEFVRVGTLLSCAEMIRSGTTTFADMYYFEEEAAKAVDRAGMRGVLGETVIGFPVPDARTPEDALAYTEAFIGRWKSHPRVVPAVAPHAPYTVSPEILKKCFALAERNRVPMLIHVAETKAEDEQIRKEYGKSPVAHLSALGVLSPRTVAAHCVHVDEEDIDILVKSGVGCVENPESNMKLASGMAPVTALLRSGLHYGLGTDGPASNNDLDMFQAMDFAGKLAKIQTMDPTALPARELVTMATRGGAEVLGLADRIGSLEVGKRADLIVLRTDSAKSTPLYDPASHIAWVLKGPDVAAVWVDGKRLYDGSRVLTLDEAAIRKDALRLQKKVLASLAEVAK